MHSLRRSTDFLSLKRKGRRYSPRPWVTINYDSNKFGHLRYGCTISRKVGTAVLRNRLKRWCREYFIKALKNGFDKELDINVVFKPVEQEFYKKLSHIQLDLALDAFIKKLQ